jgi:DNA-binding GntR family transcriptional regulator
VRLQPGQRLLEVELASALEISRAPLREAFRLLAADGLVEIRQNRGAYVVDPSSDDIADMSLTRALLEGAAARLLAHRRDVAALSQLERILGSLKDAEKRSDRDGIIDLHWDFHRSICVGSANPYILRAWSSASTMIRIYYRMQISSEIIRNNSIFLRVIRDRPPEEAEAILRGQIIRTAYRILQRPIPEAVRGYVSFYIDDDGTIVEEKRNRRRSNPGSTFTRRKGG